MTTIQVFFDKDSQRKAFINATAGRIIPVLLDVQFNPRAFFICFQPVRAADTARLVILARNYGAVLINTNAADAAMGAVAGKYEKMLNDFGIPAKAQCIGESLVRFFVDNSIRMQLIVFMIADGYIPQNSQAGLDYIEYDLKNKIAA